VWQSYSGQNFEGVPVVENKVVYINSSRPGTWAFNAETGEKIWNTNFNTPTCNLCSFNPLYKDGKVYVVVSNGVHRLNSLNGQVEWSYTIIDTAETSETNPVIGGNLLFTSTKNTNFPITKRKIIAIDITNGTKAWEYNINSFICQNPVLFENLLIFGAEDGKIYALDQKSGSIVWTRDFSVSSNNYGSAFVSPVIYKNLVIVHNGNRGYFGLNASTGEPVWNYAAAAIPTFSSPATGNGLVYFSLSTKAVALDALTGNLIWESHLDPTVQNSSPTFVKNRLYFGNNYGNGHGIVVLDAITGNYITTLVTMVSQTSDEVIVDSDTTYYLAESGMVQ
jgi:outer membrane protein assembly factor BamB